MPFPIADDTIYSIIADGEGEGIEDAIRQNMSIIKAADIAMVFTDGHIGDEPVNKKYLHSKGIFTYGLYCGDREDSTSLDAYFDKVIVKSDIVQLAEALILAA